jgi:hypothetical protein
MRQAIIFKSRWGWMGISETTKGIDAVVLPKRLRRAVLSELRLSDAELLEGRMSLRLPLIPQPEIEPFGRCRARPARRLR